MANIAARGRKSVIPFTEIVFRFFRFVIRALIVVFIVLMVLFLWTDDFYDYTNWDIELGLQLLGFTGMLVGLIWSFFRTRTSGYIVLISSFYFWVITFIVRSQLWLGWGFLFFPSVGLLLINYEKLERLYSRKFIGRKKKITD
jgi:hypothetical protein